MWRCNMAGRRGINNGILRNINYVYERDYGIMPDGNDVWPGHLPYGPGSTFPDKAIKDRASISATNRLIFDTDIDEIFTSILSIVPEIDPMYGWQIREIIANAPYLKNACDRWTALIAGEAPTVDCKGELDIKVNDLLERSNWATAVQDEARSRCLDVIGAVLVDVDINGNPTILNLDVKNFSVYMSKEYPTSIEVVLVHNIYKENNKKYCEFTEFYYDGRIKRTVFKYGKGKLGSIVEDKCKESVAFNGKHKASPIVVFPHNTIKNETYGRDNFRYWSSSAVSAMRSLQNILRLGERTREQMRLVPDNAIDRDPDTGESVYRNKGTLSYNPKLGKDKIPEYGYKSPDIKMDEAIKAFEKSIKELGMDTGLGPVFFDLEKLGTNMSAKSIEAALYPTKLEAKRIATEMKRPLKELVIKLCYLADIELNYSDVSITMYDGFPKDIKDLTDAICARYDRGLITREDALRKLDNSSMRIARETAYKIAVERKEITESTNSENEEMLGNNNNNKDKELVAHDIGPTAGESEVVVDYEKIDNTVFENQLSNPGREFRV